MPLVTKISLKPSLSISNRRPAQLQSVFDNPGFPFGGSDRRGAMKKIMSLEMIQKQTSLTALVKKEAATAWDLHNAITQYNTHNITSLQSRNVFDIKIADTFNVEFAEII